MFNDNSELQIQDDELDRQELIDKIGTFVQNLVARDQLGVVNETEFKVILNTESLHPLLRHFNNAEFFLRNPQSMNT